MGVVQRQLSNGMRVNLMSLDSEPQRASMRLYVPGGRMLEDRTNPGRCHVIELHKMSLFIYIPWTKYGLLTLFIYTLTGLFYGI
jgi:hypothetical protein